MEEKSFPLMIIVIGILLFTLIFLVKYRGQKTNYSFASGQSKNIESCVQCHYPMEGFSDYHNPAEIGCTSCHLGNGTANKKEESHLNMIRIPGNLSNAGQTCGQCHPSQLNKIENSLMTTNSGILAVNKYIFGESEDIDQHYHIKDLEYSAADMHIRDLCANCHLGAEKKEFGPITQLSRGGGCNACHLNYSSEAKKGLNRYFASNKRKVPEVHPSSDIFVNDTHCFGCHSRSGRISTNYKGLQETLLDEDQIPDQNAYAVLEDKRVYKKQTEDVHHSKGMLCIDCHSSHEVMGNGNIYAHKEESSSVQCSDCHFKVKPKTISFNSLDSESLLVFLHRDYDHSDSEFILTQQDGHPLVNTFIDSSGNAFLIGKKDGSLHSIHPQAEVCAKDQAHAALSCTACHAAWVPKCIGCHNQYDPYEQKAFDLLDRNYKSGQWKEYVAEFSSSYPSLGVRENAQGKRIEPAIPGMILTIDKGSYAGNSGQDILFHRLYAPISPHTTSANVRDCKSCHTNGATLGYGEGVLNYQISNEEQEGKWSFTPEYALNKNDNLPEDAWIPFLKEPEKNIKFSTRSDFRPLSMEEQKKILLVGACLHCHESTSKVMQTSLLNGLEPVLKNLSNACILPED